MSNYVCTGMPVTHTPDVQLEARLENVRVRNAQTCKPETVEQRKARLENVRVYFMGNTDDQIDLRCRLNTGTRQKIVVALLTLIDQHNELNRLFRITLDQMAADNYRVTVIDDNMEGRQ